MQLTQFKAQCLAHLLSARAATETVRAGMAMAQGRSERVARLVDGHGEAKSGGGHGGLPEGKVVAVVTRWRKTWALRSARAGGPAWQQNGPGGCGVPGRARGNLGSALVAAAQPGTAPAGAAALADPQRQPFGKRLAATTPGAGHAGSVWQGWMADDCSVRRWVG